MSEWQGHLLSCPGQLKTSSWILEGFFVDISKTNFKFHFISKTFLRKKILYQTFQFNLSQIIWPLSRLGFNQTASLSRDFSWEDFLWGPSNGRTLPGIKQGNLSFEHNLSSSTFMFVLLMVNLYFIAQYSSKCTSWFLHFSTRKYYVPLF